jgi:hypothetical protein
MKFFGPSIVLLGLAGVSCQRLAGEVSAPPAPPSAVKPTGVPGEGAVSPAQAALDQMDTRIQVPLLPMMADHQKQDMRDHLLAVQEIVLAASMGDFAAAEQASKRMGYSDEMGQMCAHMGAGAPGFTEQAVKFHHTADSISAAARAHDQAGMMRALGSVLQTCTGCHATFRQSVVDEATWNRLTSLPAPSGHGGTL